MRDGGGLSGAAVMSLLPLGERHGTGKGLRLPSTSRDVWSPSVVGLRET